MSIYNSIITKAVLAGFVLAGLAMPASDAYAFNAKTSVKKLVRADKKLSTRIKNLELRADRVPEKGDRGDVGPQGPAGAAGAQGAQGIQGVAGAQGPKGDIGATGAKGDQGAQGIQGIPGIVNAQACTVTDTVASGTGSIDMDDESPTFGQYLSAVNLSVEAQCDASMFLMGHAARKQVFNGNGGSVSVATPVLVERLLSDYRGVVNGVQAKTSGSAAQGQTLRLTVQKVCCPYVGSDINENGEGV